MYYGTNMVLDMALKSGKCRKVGRCFQYFHLQKTIPKKQPRVEYGKTSTSFPVRIDFEKKDFYGFFGVWVSVLDDTNSADVVMVVGVTTLQISTLNNC